MYVYHKKAPQNELCFLKQTFFITHLCFIEKYNYNRKMQVNYKPKDGDHPSEYIPVAQVVDPEYKGKNFKINRKRSIWRQNLSKVKHNRYGEPLSKIDC